MTTTAPRAAETDTAPASYGHRSQAIVASDYLFTGGQIGAPLRQGNGHPDHAAEGSFEEQVAICLEHLDAITTAQGSSRLRVVELAAFVAEPDARHRLERVVNGFFGTAPPLLHYQEVSDVALHGLVELDWIVSLDDTIPIAEAAAVISALGSNTTDDAVVVSGPFLITNGVLGRGDTMTAAAKDAFAQVSQRLSTHGASLESVLKMTVYIDQFDRYPEFNAVTQRLLNARPLPTRSVVVSSAITGDAALRIDLVAQP